MGVPMNYKSELQRLKRLLHADHNAYLNELDKPWPNMDEDLNRVHFETRSLAASG